MEWCRGGAVERFKLLELWARGYLYTLVFHRLSLEHMHLAQFTFWGFRREIETFLSFFPGSHHVMSLDYLSDP